MESAIRWIKIEPGMFDNRKIRQLETMPDGDGMIVIWLKLLCLAGNINDCGLVYMTRDIPYTEEMLAAHFNRPINLVKLALETFKRFGMINITDDILRVTNWERYQAIERGEDASVPALGSASECRAKTAKYAEIVEAYHTLCPSFPRVQAISKDRKSAMSARLNQYSLEQFFDMFKMAEESDFLKGANKKNWRANFDWLMRDANFAKVLDGNYSNRFPVSGSQPAIHSLDSLAEEMERRTS